MQRVLVNTAATLSVTFTVDGVPTDPNPDSATVTVTRADGTALVTGQAATNGAGAGVFTYQLQAAQTDLLDTLTVEWTSNFGTITTFTEVVGGFLFTIGEARAIKPLDNTTVYPTVRLIEMRTTVEQALEDACGVAFVPRYTLETISGTGTDVLPLKWPKIRAVRSAAYTYNGTATALTAGELGMLSHAAWGGITGYSWAAGYGNWAVGYEHGHDRPPERVRRAALLLAKSWLVQGPIDDRTATFNAGQDGGTYSLVVPGRNGSHFGLPEVDQVVNEYGLRVGVA